MGQLSIEKEQGRTDGGLAKSIQSYLRVLAKVGALE